MPRTKIEIISVDDEQDTRILYQFYFTNPHNDGVFSLRFTHDHDECMQWLGEAQRPTVVLMDINLPILSGQERLYRIKQQYPKSKVIMVSAYGQSDKWEKCRQLGADAYVQKPVDFEVLKSKILQLCPLQTEG